MYPSQEKATIWGKRWDTINRQRVQACGNERGGETKPKEMTGEGKNKRKERERWHNQSSDDSESCDSHFMGFTLHHLKGQPGHKTERWAAVTLKKVGNGGEKGEKRQAIVWFRERKEDGPKKRGWSHLATKQDRGQWKQREMNNFNSGGLKARTRRTDRTGWRERTESDKLKEGWGRRGEERRAEEGEEIEEGQHGEGCEVRGETRQEEKGEARWRRNVLLFRKMQMRFLVDFI